VNRKNLFVDHKADVPPGPEGAMQYVGGAYKRFPDIHVEILDLNAEDDHVVVRDHWMGAEGQRKRV
jgi:hypothetical protein